MRAKLFILYFLLPFLLYAQPQIGVDLDGEATSDSSGFSVSLSNDGSIMAVGAIFNDGNGSDSGHVRVYQNTGGTWAQIGADIDGETGLDESGWSVSLNADGSILAIGAVRNLGTGGSSGHVRVYQNTGGTWAQIGGDIDGEAAGDTSGWSVSLSSDGNIVAIGAPFNQDNGFRSGHVRVYQNTGGSWTQIGQDIDGEAEFDKFGWSVSLSEDGSTLAIGAFDNDGINGLGSGHVRVFQNTGGNWSQIGADIDGDAPFDQSGWSVSLSSDGNIVAIGSYRSSLNGAESGHVKIFENTGGVWNQLGANIEGESAGDQSGFSLSLSADGSIVAIGAINNNGMNGSGSGHARVYRYSGGAWIQIGTDIDGEATSDRLGYSISISGDGNTVAIGADLNDGNGNWSGHVRVFDLSNLGVNDNSLIGFAVYPSPTSGILNVKSETTISQIEIYNQLGQLVAINNDQSVIDISSVSAGLYLIKLKDEKGNTGAKKVIKN